MICLCYKKVCVIVGGQKWDFVMKKVLALCMALVFIGMQCLSLIPVHAAGTNLIANSSLETATNTTTPTSWTSSAWGTNTRNFTYKHTEGHTGTSSGYVAITKYTNGDAKWWFNHVAIKANTKYSFSDYSKSNVQTRLVAEYKTTSNTFQYVELGNVAASASNWQQKNVTFTSPANVKSVTVFHVLDKVGWLQTDDFFLAEESTTPPAPVIPTVAIASPTASQTVSGTQTIAATATNAVGVQFKLDNANLGTEDTTAPYSATLDTTTLANGTHTLSAIARSSDGTTAIAPNVSIIVNNTATPPTPPTSPDNLIPNPSLETANGSVPASWNSNKWGTNTASFTYLTSGHTGSKSVRTQVTGYTSGDAKWYVTPVTIQPNTTYAYSHYYQSNVVTEAVLQYTDAAGNNTYVSLGSPEASSAWKEMTYTFTTPANAVKVSMFHVVARVGSLTVDDASLVKVVPPTPPNPSSNPILNPSLETANGTNPANWSGSSWGTNTAKYEYLNEGHSGNKSVKVTVSNYTDGDAKWMFDPLTSLTPGAQYRISTYYKTNTVPHAVAMFTKADGTEQYYGLPNPQPSGDTNQWQLYSDTFTMPVDAKSASVFFFVSNNGWVQTDDYSISPYQPVGFSRPLVTLTFDDGHEDNVNSVLPVLTSHGFKSTQCYATDYIEGIPSAIMDVLAFKNAGHEICSHTVTHPQLTQLSLADATYEVTHSQDVLESIIGEPVRNFASPYGDYNQAINNILKTLYRSHRTVDEGYNSKDNFDPYRVRVQNMLSTTTLAEYQSWLDHAKATNTWLVLVYHRVADDPGDYDTTKTDFAAQMNALTASHLTVLTYNQALDEITPQL